MFRPRRIIERGDTRTFSAKLFPRIRYSLIPTLTPLRPQAGTINEALGENRKRFSKVALNPQASLLIIPKGRGI